MSLTIPLFSPCAHLARCHRTSSTYWAIIEGNERQRYTWEHMAILSFVTAIRFLRIAHSQVGVHPFVTPDHDPSALFAA